MLGFAYVAPWRTRPAYGRTVEDTVYLAQAAVGRSLGTLLLGALLEEAARAGARQVIGVVADGPGGDGAASVALHRRLGFGGWAVCNPVHGPGQRSASQRLNTSAGTGRPSP